MDIPKNLPENIQVSPVRREVLWFAELMEQKLSQFDTSRNWKDAKIDYLLGRLHDEFLELTQLLKARTYIEPFTGGNKIRYATAGVVNEEAVIEEAVDMANFCMMIADLCRRQL